MALRDKSRLFLLAGFLIAGLASAAAVWAYPPCGAQVDGHFNPRTFECIGAASDCTTGTVCPPAY